MSYKEGRQSTAVDVTGMETQPLKSSQPPTRGTLRSYLFSLEFYFLYWTLGINNSCLTPTTTGSEVLFCRLTGVSRAGVTAPHVQGHWFQLLSDPSHLVPSGTRSVLDEYLWNEWGKPAFPPEDTADLRPPDPFLTLTHLGWASCSQKA